MIVATVRALKMHGGGSPVVPGRPLANEYKVSNNTFDIEHADSLD